MANHKRKRIVSAFCAVAMLFSATGNWLLPLQGIAEDMTETGSTETAAETEAATDPDKDLCCQSFALHPNGENAEQSRVRRHEYAAAETVLHGLKVVCEKRHKSADLVFVVELLRQFLAVIEHQRSEIRLHFHRGAEKAYTPYETPYDEREYDEQKRQTYIVKQHVHIKRAHYAVDLNFTVYYPVQNRTVELRHYELNAVHDEQRHYAEQ